MFRTALRFIVFDKPKSIGALFGVVISIFLIGQQTGIFIFLTGAMSRLVDNMPADIWVVDAKTTNVSALGQLDARLQREIESIKGIERVSPIVIAGGSAKFDNGKTAGVNVIGAVPPDFIGGPWNISKGNIANLLIDGAVSADFFDKKILGDADYNTVFEINGKRAKIDLQTKGVRGFGASYMFTTIARARYYANMPNTKVSALLIKVKDPKQTQQIIAEINSHIYGVKAWTKEDFSKATVSTVLGSSGIALSVGTLIIFAIVAGSVIIGLTLYSSAMDRIKDYATLKAIGATNGFVSGLILIQALIFAFVGFGIGVVLMNLFRQGIANAGTIFYYTPIMYLAFFAITVSISLLGAISAMRKITSVEPASVFRG